MRLVHKDFPGKKSPLKSIEIKGDSLLWTYQSGFFSQNASVPISSLVDIKYENNELIWAYRIFTNDASGRVDDVAETLSAEGQTKSENDFLARLYWELLKTLNPHEYSSRRNAEQNTNKRNSGNGTGKREEKNERKDHTKNEHTNTKKDHSDKTWSANSSQQGKSESQSTSNASDSTKTEIKRALYILGGSLSKEKRRKFKSTLRLIHHPDHGGDQEFFIELESALVDLEW